ncbi:MAG: LytR/AlgR family response regulator transcription factor, partial [Cyclobacteriaceae bacterium]
MSKIKAIIIEDEPLAIERLIRLLGQVDTPIEILESLTTVKNAVKWLSMNTCDLIFLDIHLSDGNSFKIFEQVQVNTPVIFTSAYDQYAIKAFELNSIDYLLKPFNVNDLRRALEKHKQRTASNSTDGIDFTSLLESLKAKETSYQKRFVVQSG